MGYGINSLNMLCTLFFSPFSLPFRLPINFLKPALVKGVLLEASCDQQVLLLPHPLHPTRQKRRRVQCQMLLRVGQRVHFINLEALVFSDR